MQAVAAASLAAGGTPPSTECPPVDLADPAASPSAPACAREDQNSNVVVVGGEMHDATMNHNHVHHQQQQQQDCAESSFDESAAAVTAPSTLTLRLIMQGKVTCRCLCCACRGCAISADNLCLPLQDDPASRPHGRVLGA